MYTAILNISVKGLESQCPGMQRCHPNWRNGPFWRPHYPLSMKSVGVLRLGRVQGVGESWRSHRPTRAEWSEGHNCPKNEWCPLTKCTRQSDPESRRVVCNLLQERLLNRSPSPASPSERRPRTNSRSRMGGGVTALGEYSCSTLNTRDDSFPKRCAHSTCPTK